MATSQTTIAPLSIQVIAKIPPPNCLCEGERFRVLETDPRYGVTDFGRVFSRAKTGGRSVSDFWRELKNQIDAGGYLIIYAAGKRRRVHHLVLQSFMGPCGAGRETRHLNGVKTDNRLKNLRWGSKVENMRDKLLHGNHSRGERSSLSALTNAEVAVVRELRRRHPGWSGVGEFLARWFSTNRSTISRACGGRSYLPVDFVTVA